MISTEEYNSAVREYTKNVFRFLMKSLKDEDAEKILYKIAFSSSGKIAKRLTGSKSNPGYLL